MWLQVVNMAVGVWVMVTPAVLPSTEPGAVVSRIAGPLAISVAVLALRGVTRPVRALNVLTGAYLTIAPWLVANTGPLILSSVLTGWALIVLSIPRGHVHQRTGGGWWTIVRPELIGHTVEN